MMKERQLTRSKAVAAGDGWFGEDIQEDEVNGA